MKRYLKKSLLKTIYTFGGFAPFHWTNRERILILMYHRFSQDKMPYRVSKSEFASHLHYLGKHHKLLALSEVVDDLANDNPLPPHSAVITIDDGYADAYEIAFPLLRKYGLPATLFAVTGFLDKNCWLWTDLTRYILLNTKVDRLRVEFENDVAINSPLTDESQRLEIAALINARLKQMPNALKEAKLEEIAVSLQVVVPASPAPGYLPITWQQAREMDAGNVKIESHTVTHPIMTNIDKHSLDFELKHSKVRLESELNREIEHFCYPNGAYDGVVKKSVEAAGYKSAVTTNYGFNINQDDRFDLRRIDAHPTIENFVQSVTGFELARQKVRI